MTPNQRILEVGCGTGAFTKEILKHLQDGDELDIVELNPEFCKTMESTLLPVFWESHPGIRVELHNAPIEEAVLAGKFDAIVCGLPFNNFSVDVVQHLFEVMFDLLKKGSELAYFEYLGIRGFKRLFGFPSIRRETALRTVGINQRFAERNGTQHTVWRNMPSCRVVRLKA